MDELQKEYEEKVVGTAKQIQTFSKNIENGYKFKQETYGIAVKYSLFVSYDFYDITVNYHVPEENPKYHIDLMLEEIDEAAGIEGLETKRDGEFNLYRVTGEYRGTRVAILCWLSDANCTIRYETKRVPVYDCNL